MTDESLEEAGESTEDESTFAPDDVAPPPPFGRRSNRRVRASGLRTCRLCWRPITIEAQNVEEDPPHIYFRCPSCMNAFPIRRSDLPAGYVSSEPLKSEPSASSPTGHPAGEIWALLGDNVVDQLDFEAVRGLLEQLNAVHARHGETVESKALHGALSAREQILIAMEDLASVLKDYEAEDATSHR